MSELAARRIAERLRGAGFQALYAGGAVRDRLLGREAQDFDVATDATPDQVMALFPRHSAVGAQFGVVLVHDAEAGPGLSGTPARPSVKRVAWRSHARPRAREAPEASVEVATFRTESSYRDGRHPEGVRYASTAREDVLRRDFTINGLLLDPATGEILDYVGGRADLAAGIIRAIGDPERRFQEDRLRMLRGVRFAARLGFTIEPATLAAIREHAPEILQISAERIRDEILKMLTEGHARRAFELLDATGLLAHILPEVAAMHGVEQPPQFHPEGDVWVHTLLLLEALPHPVPPALALGALLHDVGKPKTFRRAPDRIRFDRHAAVGAAMAAAIGQRLRLPNADRDELVALVADHMQWIELPKMRESTRKRFLRRPAIDNHLELLRLDCSSSHGDLSLYHLARQQLAALKPDELRPPRLLTGADLIAMGYPPGPRFKEILTAVEDAQLEGTLADVAAARQFVLGHFPPPEPANCNL